MPASSLPNLNITAVPAAPDVNFPSLTSITVADLVGPLAANRQPISLSTRTDTLRDRVNDLLENMNLIATGGGDTFDFFLPRDGSHAMTDDLDMGGKKVTNVGAATAGGDALSQADGDARYVNVAGDTMADALNMGGNQINNAADGVVATDLATVGQVPALSGAGTFPTFEVFDTTGAGVFVVPAGVTQIEVMLWGAGGGGGSTQASINAAAGGGGGAFARAVFTVTPSANINFSIGAGGAGGGAAPVPGGTGGQTFWDTSSILFANGGVGGAANDGDGGVGGTAGGTATPKEIMSGHAGNTSERTTLGGLSESGGFGGGSPRGGGGGIGRHATAAVRDGTAPGGGGSGAKDGGTFPAGAGAAGRIIVSYFP